MFKLAALCLITSVLAADTVEVAGLKQPAEILVDRWGVAHIYAKSTDDAFFVQGFNAARDRLFQIDLWRRRGPGELSEVLGPSYVEQDKASRLFLYRGDMAKEWAWLKGEYFPLLYTRGAVEKATERRIFLKPADQPVHK